MINFIMSMLIAVIPDVIYYMLAILGIKGIKNKRILLFVLVIIGYIIFNMLIRYKLCLYLLFDVYIYFILKLLYKSEINDFFLIITIDCFYMFVSTICFILIPNYFIAFVISKIILFGSLILNRTFNKIYKNYKLMWNRSLDRKMPIKSLTIRNISLLLLNITILLFYVVLIFIIESIG